MNIVELKNKFDELSFNLIREYTNLEKKYLEEKDKNTKDLTQVNSINESMVTTLEKNDLEISNLHKQLSCKDQIIESLENNIIELKEELEESKKETEEKTKFDMIRAQNDEIHAKSKEIERLNKIIRLKDEKEKEMKNQPELTRTKSEEELLLTGDPIITPSSSDEEKNIEVTIEDVNEVINEVINNDEKELDDDEKTQDMSDAISDEEVSYSVIKYRKVEYYIDECEPPNVYEIAEDEDVGNKLGTWEKNSKGKMTINKKK